MTNGIGVRRGGRAFYALPAGARSHFRRRVFEARSGREEALAAFAAVGIDDVVVHTLDLFDQVAAGFASLNLDDKTRGATELALFGAYMFFLPADVVAAASRTAPQASELIQEVLARGRADNLDDRQMAGGIQVVLESHGYLPGAAA